MDFDKQEDNLDARYNLQLNRKKDRVWNLEELKLNELRINHLEAQLFFLYVDRYVNRLENDILDKELDEEYRVLNK